MISVFRSRVFSDSGLLIVQRLISCRLVFMTVFSLSFNLGFVKTSFSSSMQLNALIRLDSKSIDEL